MVKKRSQSYADDLSLEDALFAFRRKLTDIMREGAEELKCPTSQIDALAYIVEKGDPSMKEIAGHLKITPPSATAIVEIMQKKGLLTRVSSEKDKREIRVALTPKAWKLFRSLHKRKLAIFTTMLSKLSDADKNELIRIITILIKE
jgi:DNA-binding MarR family transcriptional regulator